MSIHKISEDYSVTGQISPEHLAQIAQMGFKSVICNRPDGEGMMQPAFNDIAAAATAVGIKAEYMPVIPGPPNMGDAVNLQAKLETLEAPVLAYCASGARAANLWNLCEQIKASKQTAA